MGFRLKIPGISIPILVFWIPSKRSQYKDDFALPIMSPGFGGPKTVFLILFREKAEKVKVKREMMFCTAECLYILSI